jgi:hypothetical protein
MVKCSNCGELYAGEAIKPDAHGGWRHPSKCGPELRDLVVRRPSRPEPAPQAPRQPWAEDRPYDWEGHVDMDEEDGEGAHATGVAWPCTALFG